MRNELLIRQLQNHGFIVLYCKNDHIESYHFLNCKMKVFFIERDNIAYFTFGDKPDEIHQFKLTKRCLFVSTDLKELADHCSPSKNFMMKYGKLIGKILIALIITGMFWITFEHGEGFNRGNEYRWDSTEQ